MSDWIWQVPLAVALLAYSAWALWQLPRQIREAITLKRATDERVAYLRAVKARLEGRSD